VRKAIGAAIIRKGRLLLVRKRQTWILPGGKPKGGESDIRCLIREGKEELPGLRLRNFRYFGTFVGTTPHIGDELRAEVYLAEADGEVCPSAEINAAEWTREPEKFHLSDITRKIILALRQKGHL